MEREYDLFELVGGGTPLWRDHASGLREVQRKLQDLAETTSNECFAMHLPTKEIVARLNVGGSRGTKPVVFQIAYDEKLVAARTQVLRLHGYEVVSVIGNHAAKAVLELPVHCDFFIIGHKAPEEERKEMIVWLKKKHPGVQILALNPPKIAELPGAHYNVNLNGPETWVPIIATALNRPSQ